MFNRWLPFILTIISHYLLIGVGFFMLIVARGYQMTQSIDISHCSSGKLSDYNQPLEICASATALNFMNDSYFLARSFFFLVCLAIFVAYTLCQWGIRRDNNLMILSGILAAVFVFNSIDGSTIAVIAIVIGHLIGYSLASIKLNRVTSLNRKINIKE